MGNEPADSRQRSRNSKTVRMATLLANLFVWPLVFLNFYMHKSTVGFVGIMFLILVNVFWLIYRKVGSFRLWSTMTLLIFMVTSWHAFYEGGVHGSGHLWAFLFPLLAYEFKGHQKANIFIVGFCVGLLLVFSVGYSLGIAPAYQTINFIAVFFVILVAVTLFFHAYEKRRFLTQGNILRDKSKYEALFNDLSLGVIMLNRDYKILESNKLMKQWFPKLTDSYAPVCYNSFHPENNGSMCVGCPVKKCFETGEVQSVEQIKKTNLGEKIYRMIANPMRDEKGYVYAVMETLEDITEQKRIEKEIIKREQEFSSLVSSLSDIVFTLDKDQKHTGVYGGWVKETGYTKDYFIGKTTQDLLGPEVSKVHKEAASVALEGTPAVFEWNISNNGNLRYFQTSLSPMRNPNGSISGLVGVGRDITQLREAHNKIEVQNRFFSLVADVSRDFVNSSPDTIDEKIDRMLQKCGVFLEVDRTFLFHITEDLQYMSNTHEWCAPDIPPVKEMLQNYPIKEVPWIAELINTGQMLFVPDVDLLPDEYKEDKDELKKQQIQSVLCLPVLINGEVRGYFGFDSVRKKRPLDDQQVYLLSVLGNILADALQKIQSEREIKEINERFDQLASQNRTITWEINQNGLYNFISPVVKEVLGYQPNEIIEKMHFYDFFPPGFKEEYYTEIFTMLEKGKAFTDFENPLVDKKGNIVWVMTNAMPVLDERNKIIGYRGFDRDITTHREMERAIRYNSLIQETISRVSALFLSAGRINVQNRVSEAFEIIGRFFEMDMASLYVKKPTANSFELQSYWCNQDVNSGSVGIQKARLSLDDYTWWNGKIVGEEPVIAGSVELLPAEAAAEKEFFKSFGVKSFYCFPFSLGSNLNAFIRFDKVKNYSELNSERISLIQFLVKIISDAIMKNIAEEALERSEKVARETAERYKAYIRASDSGAWEYYISSGKMWCSPQYYEMLGWSGEDIYGNINELPMANKIWEKLVHPDDYVQAKASLNLYLKNPEGIYEQTFRMLHQNGNYIWILSRGTILTDINDKLSDTFVGTHINITPQKKSEETIIAKNKELESYLYIASHDLRAPLVNIQGFSNRINKQISKISQYYQESTSEQEKRLLLNNILEQGLPQSLGFILSNVKKMDSLINGLLAISRTGRMKVTAAKVNVNQLINKILQDYDYQIMEIGAEIQVDNLPGCYGDPNLLNQLFSNLIDNAIKYRKEDTPLRIHVSGMFGEQYSEYTIADNGVGIESKQLAKIWDVFYRVDPESKIEGEGIGLNLVAKIAEKNHGYVKGESEFGIGTTFFVKLQRNYFD